MAETSIDRLTLDIVVNNENATRRINNITKAIEKLNTAMGKSGNIDKVLDKINNISPTSTGGGKTSNGGTNKTSKNINMFATLGKWNYLINMARYYGRSLANIVQLSMDYVETQNLWQVANRNNLEMAEQFIQKMNKAYGISEQTLMNYQAIFKNMLSALGDLSDEISSGLSMQLTQMALDFSSLYNVTIPSAMQKFQAVLSGQVRPIRSVSGYDITENTIYDLYAGAGGEKTMRQLSQIEKRLLRIVAVFEQMGATGATGDMAKTIESASNQARIMSEQFKEVLTWTGHLILMWLDNANIFQKVNAALITMKEIVKALAYDMGYEDKNFLDGMATSAEEAGEEIDKIQGKLLSFDKFNALNAQEENALGIDSTIIDLLKKVNLQTEEFTMKAQKLADEWLTALGFVDENGDGVRELNKDAKSLVENVKQITKGFGGLLLTFMLFKSPLKVVTGAMGYLFATSKEFRENTNKALTSLSESFAKIGNTFFDIIIKIAPVLEKIVSVFERVVIALDEVGLLKVALWGVFGAMIAIKAIKFAGFFKDLITWARDAMLAISRLTITMKGTKGSWDLMSNGAMATSLAFGALLATTLYSGLDAWFARMSEETRKTMGVITTLISVLVAGTAAWMAYQGAMSMGTAIPIILSAVGAGIAGAKAMIPAYATGGFPEDGLFFANSGELVGQFSNGRTAVANNDQITTGIAMAVEPAVYRAVKSAMATGNGGDIVLQLDGRELARANVGNNARALSSNYRIDLQPR